MSLPPGLDVRHSRNTPRSADVRYGSTVSNPMQGESVGLMTAHYFDNIDPQPMPTITTVVTTAH